jgi:hypothetical protein
MINIDKPIEKSFIFATLNLEANHNKDYSVVKTFKAGVTPRFYFFTGNLTDFLLSRKNKTELFSLSFIKNSNENG